MGKVCVDIVAVLDTCCRIEESNAELYRIYAEQFSESPDISSLWMKTALEEDNHASQFKLVAKLREGCIDTVVVDRWNADSTLKKVLSIIESVRKTPPSILDALRSAIKLEEHLSSFHVECAICFEDESFKKLFHSMMANDNHHVKKLKDAYDHHLRENDAL